MPSTKTMTTPAAAAPKVTKRLPVTYKKCKKMQRRKKPVVPCSVTRKLILQYVREMKGEDPELERGTVKVLRSYIEASGLELCWRAHRLARHAHRTKVLGRDFETLSAVMRLPGAEAPAGK